MKAARQHGSKWRWTLARLTPVRVLIALTVGLLLAPVAAASTLVLTQAEQATSRQNSVITTHQDNTLPRDTLNQGSAMLEEQAEARRRDTGISAKQEPRPPESAVPLSAEESAFLAAHPVIRVHNETNWPPYNYTEDGTPQGFSIDYMNLIAEKTGLTIEYVTGPSWNDFLGMMREGTLDVMLNIVKTPERQTYLTFSAPYADNPNAILSKRETPYPDIASLYGKTVAIPKGFFTEEVLRRDYPQITLYPVKNVLETMKAVAFGKADAALGELAVINYLLNNHMMTDLIVSGEALMGDPEYSLLNIATRKDLPELAAIIRKGMMAISVTEKKALQQKWLSQAAPDSDPNALTAAELAFIDQHPVIRFQVRTDRPPFEFSIDGEAVGIAVDYVRKAAENTGLTARFILDDRPVDDAIDAISRDRVPFDSLLYAPLKANRGARLAFGDAYLEELPMIATHKSAGHISQLADLRGKTLVIEQGMPTQQWIARDYPDIRVIAVDTTLDALHKVQNRAVDAYVGNIATINYLTEQHDLSDIKITAPAGYDTIDYAFAAPADWPELASILSKGLRTFSPDEHIKIHQKWFTPRFIETIDYTRLAYVTLFFLTVITIVVVKNRSIANINRELQISHREVEEKNRQLESLSITDNLTKLYNRHKLDDVISYEINRANRFASPFGVILIDVDHFKRVNDVHGHPMGDRVLQEVANILHASCRMTDTVGRWGGEEFLIICGETPLKGVVTLAEKIRHKIATFEFALKEPVTASFGVAVYRPGEEANDLIKRADDALYKAKHNGRNRVEHAADAA